MPSFSLLAWRRPAVLLSLSLFVVVSSVEGAAPPADSLFPTDTVAFFSVSDPEEFQQKWNQTQVGQFTSDESMQPFVKQIRGQLIERFGNIQERLGVTFDDLTAAAGGEVGVGMLHREGVRASVAVLIDTTGKDAEAQALIDKADAELIRRGGERTTEQVGGVTLTVFKLPKNERRRVGRTVVHFRQQEVLCAVDDLDYAKQLLQQIGQAAGPSLATQPNYRETMNRCRAEANSLAPDVRWFVNPFAWDSARRTLHDEPLLANRKDTVTILREQGFDAIRALGGFINLAVTAEQDIIHRTAIYAPPKPGAEGKQAKEKYNLGMRMAELPNRHPMPVEKWAPRMTATYTTANLDLLNAFDHAASLFDAMSGYEGAFRTTLDSFEVDPYGPEIKVREQLIKNLGKRITMMTDYKLPITPDCERYLFVVEVTNPGLLRSPIDKLMENDGALPRELKGVPYWEIVPEEETLTKADLEGGLLSIDDTAVEEEAENRQRVLRRAAVCLYGSQLIVTSDVEFLRQVLFGVEDHESLAASLDFQTTMEHLDGLLTDGKRCSWSFFRTDESIRPSYELIRRGEMPQSQTFFGRLLNELLTTQEDEEQGVLRKQRVDGSSLPTFELARRYFGPAGRVIRSDDDGWFITGVVLSKAGQ